MKTKIQQISLESIRLLVDNFYNKVLQEKELKPIFEDKIGKSEEDWQPHLQNMYDFWSSIMLSSGKYKGNPLQKHRDLPAFDESKFEIWLRLFADTAREIHPEEIANQYIERSKLIARGMRYGLYYRPETALNLIKK